MLCYGFVGSLVEDFMSSTDSNIELSLMLSFMKDSGFNL